MMLSSHAYLIAKSPNVLYLSVDALEGGFIHRRLICITSKVYMRLQTMKYSQPRYISLNVTYVAILREFGFSIG